MIERLDSMWERGEFLNFKDIGKPDRGKKTHIFIVHNRISGTVLGEVRWFTHWRQYVIFPATQTIFDKKCLRELSEYCELKTTQHRSGVPYTRGVSVRVVEGVLDSQVAPVV